MLTPDDVKALFGLTAFKYAVNGTTTTVYVVNDTSFTKDDAPIVLYSSINVPKEWDNTKMNSIFGDPKLEISLKLMQLKLLDLLMVSILLRRLLQRHSPNGQDIAA